MSSYERSFVLVAEALRRGASRGRLRSSAFDAPFHGVRARTGALFGLEQVCAAYALKMPEGSVFAGVTAARLWGMPLPLYLGSDIHSVDVSARAPRRAPQGVGVCGSQYNVGMVTPEGLRGLPVLSQVDTWCSVARVLDFADLVAVSDHLLSDAPGSGGPFATMTELEKAVACRSGGRGAIALRRALTWTRPSCWSRTETLTRIVLTSAGIPEPALNFELRAGSRQVRLDLAWPDQRFGLEYDGDMHRDPARFRDDIARQELVQDEEWGIMRITSRDLFDEPRQLVKRVAQRLAARAAVGITLDMSQMVRPRR
jgi:hypothetical protein